MKTRYIKFFLLLVLCVYNTLHAQYNRFTFNPADTNYNDLVSHFLYGYTGTNPDTNKDNEIQHFADWQTFWGPRLSPSGSFNIAAAAKQNNFTLSTSNPTARTSSAITSNWTPLGPFGGISGNNGAGVGRINAIAFDPNYNGTSIKTMYCGGENSGLWKYDGTTWTSMNTDDQLAQLGIADIEIDPVLNAGVNNIYIATADYNLYSEFTFGSAGVYFSSDNGLTWNPIKNGMFDNPSYAIDNSVSKILIDPTNSTDMYAATSDGIYKCTNRQSTSASWTRVYPSATTAEYTSNILFDPGYNGTTNKNMYSFGFNIMKSTDGGTTWTSLTASPNTGLDLTGTPNLTAAPFGPSNNVSSANPSGYIDYIRDMNSVISSDGRYLTVSLVTTVTNGPPFGWFSALHGYIYQYDTHYGTWTEKTSSTTYLAYIYRLAFQISPTDNNRMYIGNNYVRETSDGANTWIFADGNAATTEVFSSTETHSDVRAIEFDPSDLSGNTLFVGNDGGVYKVTLNSSTGVETSFTPMNNGLAVSTLYNLSSSAIDPYQIAASMQDDGNNYLKNSAWTHLGDGAGDGFQSVMDYKHENVFYTTDGSSIWSTDNDANSPGFGGSIKPTGLSGQYNSIPLALDPVNPSIIYAAGGELWKSTSGDATTYSTWTKISDFASHFSGNYSSIFRIAIAPSNTQTIYLSDFYGTHLFKTTVGGGTASGNWVDVTPSTGNPTGYTSGYVIAGLAVSSTDPNKVWIGYSGYDASSVNKVQVSTNGGSTWTALPWVDNSSNALPNLPVNYIVYETGSNDGIYVATDAGVYYHNNYMTGFEPFMTNLPNVVVNWLEINYTANKIRAATYGRGAWESDLACPVNYNVTESTAYSTNAFVEAGNNLYSIADDAGYNVSYRAVNEVDLQPGFHASPTTTTSFHAFIHGCSSPGNSFRRAGENQDGSIRVGMEEDDDEELTINKNTTLGSSQQSIDVIPNPNGGAFTLKINDTANQGVYTINITDISGRLVKDLENIKDKNIKIDLTSLPSGFYFVKVVTPTWQSFKKIIIQN